MEILVQLSSMVPIYQQITDQVKTLIRRQRLRPQDSLPSVRALSRQLGISALTVKKAYDLLEAEGFTVTVPGKGTYVAPVSPAAIAEEQHRLLEEQLRACIAQGRRCGIEDPDIRRLFTLILEE